MTCYNIFLKIFCLRFLRQYAVALACYTFVITAGAKAENNTKGWIKL